MSCHSVLEYDEVRMFHKLGHRIFSPSAYYNPQSSDYLRQGIDGLIYDQDDVEMYKIIEKNCKEGTTGKDYLTKEFVNRFDIIFVMDLADRWIINQWDVLKDKIVIWRTIGQSNQEKELRIKNLKSKFSNLKIARYSPTENTINNYAGEDCIIRFGKRPNEYFGWNGKNKQMISICQSMKSRSDACSWHIFKQLAEKFPSTLYGLSNEENEYWIGKKVSTVELMNALRDNVAYFYGGTKPANYTLNFIEAWMTGIPIIAIGPELGNRDGYKTYEIQNLIENGKNGFISDNINELESYINELMNNDILCNSISKNGRESAMKYFNEYDKEKEWTNFFNSL
jgi:glycosyltransferase involved in cell wall biosynthesis